MFAVAGGMRLPLREVEVVSLLHPLIERRVRFPFFFFPSAAQTLPKQMVGSPPPLPSSPLKYTYDVVPPFRSSPLFSLGGQESRESSPLPQGNIVKKIVSIPLFFLSLLLGDSSLFLFPPLEGGAGRRASFGDK